MCGIIAYVGRQSCAPIVLDALGRLEYRGYDSAGMAVKDDEGRLGTVRAVGKLRALSAALAQRPLPGRCGIGHTRWATHGAPSEVNAHPHVVGKVAVVHNGIIENHAALRRTLLAQGAAIQSDTDTEIVAHLIALAYQAGGDLRQAVAAAVAQLEGAYALAVVAEHTRPEVVVAKQSSPLVLGVGSEESYCASDVAALLPFTREMIFLEDGELAVLGPGRLAIQDMAGREVERAARHIPWSPVMAEKAGYKHFMLKEIDEQPRALEDTLRGRLARAEGVVVGEEIGLSEAQIAGVQRVVFMACGTSHHAALVGRHYLESLAGLPTAVELASELLSREAVMGAGDLVIAVSQSGETIDTVNAARLAQRKGAQVLAVVNVIGSALARMADAVLYTHAGPEIGVASTKCFSTQLAALLLTALHLGRCRGHLDAGQTEALVEAMARLPQWMQEVLTSTRQLCANLARRHHAARDVLYLGRGLSYPIALEGALKLKEISYIHAEGYAAGEMKHGPIALIDEHVPVIVLAPQDDSYARTLSNLQEARARGAHLIVVVSADDEDARPLAHDVIEIPVVPAMLTPFLTLLPLQLLAYYVADHKGTDVDQPRNLAKTVTVE
ncbi:MAG: glutamine--fructose-6-phosphate transaminase (isomerizing) [Polyangiales bacterium]